jgi:hypothetical protein
MGKSLYFNCQVCWIGWEFCDPLYPPFLRKGGYRVLAYPKFGGGSWVRAPSFITWKRASTRYLEISLVPLICVVNKLKFASWEHQEDQVGYIVLLVCTCFFTDQLLHSKIKFPLKRSRTQYTECSLESRGALLKEVTKHLIWQSGVAKFNFDQMCHGYNINIVYHLTGKALVST